MMAEIGTFALILAFLFAMLLVIIPTLGLRLNRLDWQASAPYYVMAHAVFVTL